jgi:acetyl esterase/lipase
MNRRIPPPRGARCALGAALAALAMGGSAGAAQLLSNLPYVSPGGVGTKLDLYLPDDWPQVEEGTPRPATFVFIHGGGWFAGDKTDDQPFMQFLADLGHPVVSPNYTLSVTGAPAFPQNIHDIKAVLSWVRTVGQQNHGLSPTIVISGVSAGSHLAMMTGTTLHNPVFEPQPPTAGGYQVQGVVAFWGPSDLVFQLEEYGSNFALELYVGGPLSEATLPAFQNASPVIHVDPCNAPTAFVHALFDFEVPYPHTPLMIAALQSAGIYTQLHAYPNSVHGFNAVGGFQAGADLVASIIPELLVNSARPDLNCDGSIDGADLGTLIGAWGTDNPSADFDRNGVVDGADLAIILAAWSA